MHDCNFIDNAFMESVYDSNLDTHWLSWMINLYVIRTWFVSTNSHKACEYFAPWSAGEPQQRSIIAHLEP